MATLMSEDYYRSLGFSDSDIATLREQGRLSATSQSTTSPVTTLPTGQQMDHTQLLSAYNEALSSGKTLEQVASQYGIPTSEVTRWATENSLQSLPTSGQTQPTPTQGSGSGPITTLPTGQQFNHDQLLAIYNTAKNNNISANQIAAQYGIPVEEVNRWTTETGLAPLPQQTAQTPRPQYTLPDLGPRPTTGAPQIPSTASPQDQARQQESKELLGQIARGDVPEAVQQNAVASPISLTGTITGEQDIAQIAAPEAIAAPTTITAPGVTTATGQAATAAAPGQMETSTVQAATAAPTAPTQAAQGSVSQEALAQQVGQQQLSEGATAVAQQVTQEDIVPGATMEAVIGTMDPEALAQAASVAGLEAARVTEAKRQLRRAGLTDQQIAEFANDPNALEMALADLTDEQKGMIQGLPVEALVSTQLDSLLQGIENGEVPTWARPAVAAVEQMLARRGMSASTVGRDALLNAVIQSAIPLAQQNAQAIQQSVMQSREFVQQASLAEAQFKQQTALQNAQNVFAFNMRNLDAQQQAALSNSQFLQTVTLTNVNNRQQAALQNAAAMASLDLATLDANTRLAAQNAQAFLQMDLANLSNEQQAVLIDTQYEQQRLLTNAAAENAARQFNASSENQTRQFMESLAANIAQFNVAQLNAMQQFNATEQNRQAAINAGNELQAQQFNAQLQTQVEQFNQQQALAVEQWNAANRQAIEQSNVQWRRQANTADTAAQNAINQQNVQNAFNLTVQAQAALWQELRDQATFDMQSYENRQDREAQLYATAIGNEAAAANNYEHTNHLVNLARMFFGGST